jgi:hypothetical protein
MTRAFGRATPAERLRFIQRTGNRYCYVADPPYPGAQPMTPPNPSTTPMALYECNPMPRRVYVSAGARVEPVIETQIALMFDVAHDPFAEVVLEREPPPPAGRSSAPVAPDAHVISERNTELIVSAAVGAGGGYLTVLDTYDPWWQVEVDGEPVPLLRANGVYRAVRLAPGEHDVRFTYRPMPFYTGLVVTLLTAAALAAACLRERVSCRRMRQAGTA